MSLYPGPQRLALKALASGCLSRLCCLLACPVLEASICFSPSVLPALTVAWLCWHFSLIPCKACASPLPGVLATMPPGTKTSLGQPRSFTGCGRQLCSESLFPMSIMGSSTVWCKARGSHTWKPLTGWVGAYARVPCQASTHLLICLRTMSVSERTTTSTKAPVPCLAVCPQERANSPNQVLLSFPEPLPAPRRQCLSQNLSTTKGRRLVHLCPATRLPYSSPRL